MAWEFAFLDALQQIRTPFWDQFFSWITCLGDSGLFWIGLALVLSVFKRTRKCGICMLACMAAGALLTNVILKPLIARERPCWINDGIQLLVTMPEDYSFPSGHSQCSFAAAIAIFCHYRTWGIVAFCLAAGIAFSRLYLYVHFPTDVLAGALVGVMVGVLMKKAWEKRIKQAIKVSDKSKR